MSNLFKKPLLVLFTLLALVGQALVSNGHAMVMQDDMASMMDSSAMACHGEMAAQSHCCEDGSMSMLPDQDSPSCCNGGGFCAGDCSHCLTISVSVSLPIAAHWPVSFIPEAAQALPLPHFHSIAPSAAFKPPKA